MTHQHGGTHYGGGWGHWDFVAETRMGYLEGNATKYLCRWREKNGIDDLKKALTYIDKATQMAEKIGYDNSARKSSMTESMLREWVETLGLKYRLPPSEILILNELTLWQDVAMLRRAGRRVRELIARQERAAGTAEQQPPPDTLRTKLARLRAVLGARVKPAPSTSMFPTSVCPNCFGRRFVGGQAGSCETCNGSGRVYRTTEMDQPFGYEGDDK